MITKASCEHTGTCDPCPQQQMIARQRSGQYVAKFSVDTIYTLAKTNLYNKNLYRKKSLKKVINWTIYNFTMERRTHIV